MQLLVFDLESFGFWIGGRLLELVAYEKWSHMDVHLVGFVSVIRMLPRHCDFYLFLLNSKVTSSPMSTNGAQYLTALNSSDSLMQFIA